MENEAVYGSRLILPIGRVNNDLNKWLEKVIDRNIDVIKQHYGYALQRGKEAFKIVIKHMIEDYGYSAPDAVIAYGKSGAFYSPQEQRIKDVIEVLKADPEIYKEFRQVYGWKKKINWERLHSTEEQNVYRIDDVVIVMSEDVSRIRIYLSKKEKLSIKL